MGLLTYLLTCIQATKEEREFNEQLRKSGLKIAVKECSDKINKMIPSPDIAIKFILQELDFSHKEDVFSQEFMLNSGFDKLEYEGALEMFQENKTQLLEIQTIFDNFLRKIKNEKEMISISMHILETVMYKWKIGKHSTEKQKKQKEKYRQQEEEKYKQQQEEEKGTIEEENKILYEQQIAQEPPKVLHQYSQKKVNALMEEYSDIIGDIIIGTNNLKEKSRIEEFKEHISRAGVEGKSSHAIVLSCFYEHKEPYNAQLPIPINQMDATSVKFFMSILKGFSKQGFSQSFLNYMDKYQEEFNLLTQQRR